MKTKLSKKLVAITGLTGLVLALGACSVDEATPDGQAAGSLECLIGGAPPLSGNGAGWSAAFTHGTDLGAEYVNERPEEFASVELDYRDGQFLPGPTIQALQNFASRDATGMVVIGTNALVAAAPVADREGFLLFNVAATTTQQREMGEWLVGNALIADDQVRKILQDATEQLGVKRVGVLADDTELGDTLTRELEKHAPEFDVEIAAIAKMSPDGSDFRQEVAPLRVEGLDAILIFNAGAHGGPAIRQAKDTGVEATYWIGEQVMFNPDTLEGAGDAANGSLHLTSRSLDEGNETAQWLAERYEEEYGGVPAEMTVHAFDSILTMAKAAHNAGSCETGAVRDAILEVTDLAGAGGILDYSNQFAEPETEWAQIVDGQSQTVDLEDVKVDG